MNTKTIFRNNLKTALLHVNKSQFAQEIGVSRQTVYKYLRIDNDMPNPNIIDSISEFLGIESHELFMLKKPVKNDYHYLRSQLKYKNDKIERLENIIIQLEHKIKYPNLSSSDEDLDICDL